MMGIACENGYGIERSEPSAIEWYRKASKGTGPAQEEAKNALARLHALADGEVNGHEYVDLGLSVNWATCNVGASSPSDYGNYYAWGETKTKSDYSEDTYEYYNGEYIDIGSNISGTIYDAARSNWGGNWRMPTKAELDELRNDCAWSWTSVNGIEGYKVTGPNGNSIFLPAAGYRIDEEIGYYWSATLYKDISDDAYFLYFFDGDYDWNYCNRYVGLPVRPVTE